MKFLLKPYDGAGPIRFGMSREEVVQLLGPSERSWTMRSGNLAESWQHMVVRFDKDAQRVIEIEFTEAADVEYQGIDLFRNPEACQMLVRLDGSALRGTGTVVLQNLGMSMTENLGDVSATGRTLCIFTQGLWDGALSRLTPYQQ